MVTSKAQETRPGLGPAPGRRGLPRQAGRDGPARAQGPGCDRWNATNGSDARISKPLRDRPFELLLELDRRARAAQGQPEARCRPAPSGSASRSGWAARLPARARGDPRGDGFPAAVTRVPGAKPGSAASRTSAASCCRSSTCGPSSAPAAPQRSAQARVLIVASTARFPPGSSSTRCMGFRRFCTKRISADLPPTLLRCERYLAGLSSAGGGLARVQRRSLLESQQFLQAGEAPKARASA